MNVSISVDDADQVNLISTASLEPIPVDRGHLAKLIKVDPVEAHGRLAWVTFDDQGFLETARIAGE